MANAVTIQPDGSDWHPKLESLYQQYGRGIYTLCLRLLADEQQAMAATADVFVRFSKELQGEYDEPHIRLRLRELAVAASLRRLRSFGVRVRGWLALT